VLSKEQIKEQALDIGFVDVGFTSCDEFSVQQELLSARQEMYEWAHHKGLNLIEGTNPKDVYPSGQSMLVVLENYYKLAFPPSMNGKFGRCYLDDDRVTRDGLYQKTKRLRTYLRDHGIDSVVPANVPHRLAAARAGLGTFGKNCMLYANNTARQSSWILPIVLIVDKEFAPDQPTVEVGCPDWCKNACIAACPTGALLGPRKLDPRRCISYLSYYGEGLTPLKLREPMGMRVYGCDRCQEVCPRNEPWLAQELDINEKVAKRADDFELSKLLHMDAKYFKERIWPHMFYMPADQLWRFQMNAARVMGNSKDEIFAEDLGWALTENQDERVRAMAAWALGKIGGSAAKNYLNNALSTADGIVKEEILAALKESH